MTESSAAPTATIVGRLAPSPTGRLHIGHARSFLLAWWHARSRGGRVLLRMEDLDRDRVKPGMSDGVLRDLEWLGLDWDGPVHVQSSDIEPMRSAVRTLLDSGLAYPCVCSRKEIQRAQSAPHADEENVRYPGTCRDRFASMEEAEKLGGRAPAVRFKVRTGAIRVEDGFAGTFACDVERESGDFPIARGLDTFAYQLAVVVDDDRTGVTEIVRGEDLLPSAARQKLLQEALHLRQPRWFHVPLVVDATGRRLAKRSDDLALSALRERGLDPRQIVAWVARHSGFGRIERATAAELAPRFDMHSVPHSPVVFGLEDMAELVGARPRA